MIQARGNTPIVREMALTYAELTTLKDLARDMSQKECAYSEHVTESCISERIKRAMKRNGYSNKAVFIADCIELIRRS